MFVETAVWVGRKFSWSVNSRVNTSVNLNSDTAYFGECFLSSCSGAAILLS